MAAPKRRRRTAQPKAAAVKLADVLPTVKVPAEPGIAPGLSRPDGEGAAASLPPAGTEPIAEPAEQPKRRRRASVGGFSKKLAAPSREGFTRRWFNDDGNRLAEADELGYSHVSDTGLKTSSPGSRVSRLVGTKANGEPLHAFLMETPDELYAEGIAEKEAVSRQVDEAITRGEDFDGQMSQIPKEERYGQGSMRPDR